MPGEEQVAVEEGVCTFARYYLTDEAFGRTPVTAYSDRLQELGLEDDSGAVPLYRDFNADSDIRITIRDYMREFDQRRAVLISAPHDVDVYEELPEEVFHGLEQRAVGTYLDGDMDTYVAAPKDDWKNTD